MAYIDWWNRTGPVTLGERFGLNEGGRIGGGIIEGTNLGDRTGFAKIEKRGKAPKPKGTESPFYKALDAKGKKIAKHVYGTLDITDSQRTRINRRLVTMDTKPITSWRTQAGEYISIKQKRGASIIDDVVFPNKEMKAEFLKDLKLRATQPMKAVVDYGNEWFADKYPISERQLKRAIPYLMEKNKIKYLKIEETPHLRNLKKRAKHLDVSSSILEEGRITVAKTKILKEKDLARKIDAAHRVSKAHMARLGLQFDTSLMGMDSRVINQVIIRPSEKKLDRLYSKQFKIFEQLKDNPTDELLKEQLVGINKQVKDIIKTTSGRLVGVTIDPNTLETSFEGLKKKYSLTQFMKENMTMKDLAKFDYGSKEQQEFLTKTLNKAVNAEVRKGFVPNDFKQILTNKKSQEAILKYATKKTPELIGKLKWAFKNPNSKVALKIMSSPVALTVLGGAGVLKILGTSTPALADDILEPSDEKQEAGAAETTLGDYIKGGAGVATGAAITHPEKAWELTKKVGSRLNKIISPLLTPAASIAAHGPHKPDVTSGLSWVTPAFWNTIAKQYGLEGTIKTLLKAPNAQAKTRIVLNMLLRAGIPMAALPAISTISTAVAGPLLISEGTQWLHKKLEEEGLSGEGGMFDLPAVVDPKRSIGEKSTYEQIKQHDRHKLLSEGGLTGVNRYMQLIK
jgi:hypothetical protein